MATETIETDYLIVGCGAAGMAFADSLISAASPDTRIVMVDRRHAPGGHWNEAYPFVRLHQPSMYYGVNSHVLGTDSIDHVGENAGSYERANAAEICAYYGRVMKQLTTKNAVRYFPMCEYTLPFGGAENRFVSRLSGAEYNVKVRRKVVDAIYLEGSVPASFAPPFDVSPDAQCIPVNALTTIKERPDGYVIIGAGKTALDAITWLLDNGAQPSHIRWIKPREAWFLNREYAQGGELIGKLLEGLSLSLEAAAQATSADDLFQRLEKSEQLLRVDETVTPTMFRGPTVSKSEIEQLRRIKGVVRLGKVRRIERDTIVLDEGSIPTTARHIHVHCAAPGLNRAKATPIFADRITLQSIRTGLLPFNAALIAFVEATRGADDAEKNRLCPPQRQPDEPKDWLIGTLNGMKADSVWSKEPDIADWLERSRLNPSRGLRKHRTNEAMQESWQRFGTNVRAGLINLERLAQPSTSQ